jgi:hypothetical protein
MFEAEYNELNIYTLKASKTVADYYDRHKELTNKDKKYIIEKVLAELDIILLWTMNIRHQILQQINTAPGTIKIQMNQALSELKTTMETAKTLSFNFTAIYHGIRDDIKETIE